MSVKPAYSYTTAPEPKEELLPSRLIKQFKDLESNTRVRSFLAEPETFEIYERNKKETIPFELPGKQPVLWYKTSSIEDKAISLQKWEGIVIDVRKDSFTAQLHDLTTKNPEEEAELPIDDVSEDDKQLLRPGAVFYWSIGYFVTRAGQVKRESVIRFRRLPAWTEKELKTIKEKAEKKREFIGSR